MNLDLGPLVPHSAGMPRVLTEEQKASAAQRWERWRAANPEKVAAARARWCAKKSPEELRAYNAERSRRWRAANPERAKAAQDKSYQNNKASIKQSVLAWREANPEKVRAMKRKNRYRLETLDQPEKMLIAQGGVCAICSAPLALATLHVDHCHRTGKVRGVLCRRCNLGLGVVETNGAEWLAATLQYATRHEGGT